MNIFYSDLDNTLIFSYRHDLGAEKTCVEIYENREVSYMTNKSYALLKAVSEQVLVVPTTTRTIEQYQRINLGLGTIPYALVCNGGVLLVNGREDEGWYRKSLEMTEESREELDRASKLLQEDGFRNFEVRNIRNLFLFTKSSMPDKSVEILKNELNTDKVQVFHNGAKVYVLPRKLDKGRAIDRLTEKLKGNMVLAAGDSAFDIPMLHAADIAFAPEDLVKECLDTEDWIILKEGQTYSDQVLQIILEKVTA